MPRFPKFDPIEFLFRRRYNLARGSGTGRPALSPEQRLQGERAWKIYEQEAAAYREELSQKSAEEIERMVQVEKASDLARSEREEAERDASHRFNRPSAIATADTYDYWSKASYWLRAEGIALLLERDPKILNVKAVKEDRRGSTTGRMFIEHLELADRAAMMGQLGFKNTPGFFLAWAKRNRLDVPEALESAVLGHGHQIADWKAAYDRQVQIASDLQARLDQLTSEADGRDASRPRGESLGLRERESLLKLVIGMAIGGYGFDPKSTRTSTTREISNDLQLRGISLDEDTIRKYLAEAKQLLPDDKPE